MAHPPDTGFRCVKHRNLGFTNREEKRQKLLAWQRENADTVITPGMYIQKRFRNGIICEYMWVRVIDETHGLLMNEPHQLMYLQMKDGIVNWKREEVMAHLPADFKV